MLFIVSALFAFATVPILPTSTQKHYWKLPMPLDKEMYYQ